MLLLSRLATAGLSLLLMSGCSSVTSFRGIAMAGNSLYVSGVPPILQDGQFACGSACVAAVAVHWGVELDEFRKRCPAGIRNTTGGDLKKMAESLGLSAYVFEGTMADLQKNLRQGRPIVVMLSKPPDPAFRRLGIVGYLALVVSERVSHPAHWVVVIGFAPEGAVIVHDPAVGPLKIRRETFQKWWSEQRNLCVLIAGK